MDRLLKIDRRWIFLLLFVSVLVPVVFPFKFAIKTSSLTRGIWEKIEALPARAPVLIALDYDPSAAPELDPVTRASLRQMFRKRLRVISMTHWPSGVDHVRLIVDEIAAEFDDIAVSIEKTFSDAAECAKYLRSKPEAPTAPSATAVVNAGDRRATGALAWYPDLHEPLRSAPVGLVPVAVPTQDQKGFMALRVTARTPRLEYGKDFVFLGTKAGEHILVINMGQSIPLAFPSELRTGKATRDLEVMRGVESLRDLKYLLAVAAGSSADWWIIYGAQRYRFPMGVACTAVMAPDLYPFAQAGQITGLSGGMKGSWEYEALVDTPGTALAAIPAQTVAHCVVILLVLFCNLGYFMQRRASS
jgi:hypothetical protein